MENSYKTEPNRVLEANGKKIASFLDPKDANLDPKTVKSFGEEWLKFSSFNTQEIQEVGDEYFDVVPEGVLDTESTNAIDIGCGTGRWSRYLSPRVKTLEGIDPSDAVFAATALNKDLDNFRVTQASVNTIPFEKGSFDFMICLGVLHHIPDTPAALAEITPYLKKGGGLLLYLYYALDNRSFAYKTLFYLSNSIRFVVSKLPGSLKRIVCDLLAILVYMPFVGLARLARGLGYKKYQSMPLGYYANKSWNIIRNDSLDRFGTPLEQRFSKAEIESMLKAAGMENYVFSDNAPYWHVYATKAS